MRFSFLIAFTIYLATGHSQFVSLDNVQRDYSWMYAGVPGFSSGSIYRICLEISPDGEPYVAFADGSNSNKLSVMRYSSGNWVYVGSPCFTDGSAFSISLDLNSNENPYVAFADGTDSNKVTVMSFNGTNWELIGPKAFSPPFVWHISIAINPAGVPYVGFDDEQVNAAPSVMKFDSGDWKYIGDKGLSYQFNYVKEINLAFDPTGELYTAFCWDYGLNTLTVMRFDGSIWKHVGGQWISHNVLGASLDFSLNGDLYVAFAEKISDAFGEPICMKLVDTSWVAIGGTGWANTFGGSNIVVKVGSSGQPYVSFKDWANELKGNVMRFNGYEWEHVGSPNFTPELNYNLDLEINPEEIPYVAFVDSETGQKASSMKYDSIYLSINYPPNSSIPRFSYYPSPANNDLHLVFDLFPLGTINIEIYTLSG